jgi:hypothetical protein
MPVTQITENDRKERFIATAGQTVFPYDFPIYAATDLQVRRERAGVITILTYGNDYSVTGAQNQTGGNVVLTNGAALNDIILILSAMPSARTGQFVNGGDLSAASLEAEFNRTRILLQQNSRDGRNALLFPPTDPTMQDLPPIRLRANRFLAFDASGQPYAATPTAGTVLDAISRLGDNMAGRFGFQPGTASLPGLTPNNDNFSGLFSPDIGIIGVSINGQEASRFMAGGLKTQQAGPGAVPRPAEEKLCDIVNVKDYGAICNGVADDGPAIQAAINSGAKEVFANGISKVGSLITVPNNVVFNFEKLIPSSASVSVLRAFGGCTLNGTIDTSAFPAYSGIALTFDGVGETSGSPFRLHIKTEADVVINGGGSTGTAIYFKAVDSIARIMGVRLNARINRYQYGVYMEQTSADLSRFITSNYINIDTSDTILALGMYSSQVNEYGVDGNHIIAKSQPNSGTTSPLFRVCGQDNTFDLLPWDWDLEAPLAPYAATIGAFTRRSLFYWHTAWAYIQNLSVDASNTFFAPHDAGIRTPSIKTARSDASLPVVATNVDLDNNRFYRGTTTGAVAVPMLGVTTSNDLALQAPSVAGSNTIYDVPNSTGVHAFRRNGTNIFFVDGAGLTPSPDNNRALGSSSARWSDAYATQFRPGAGAVIWTSGVGSPEGVVTAPVGSLYTRTDGGASTTLYVKQSGTGNTGWTAK